ncbi:hypothetical protein ccbrp13_39250 [Ktedonobacteria bacterium brp13]|nr:hypothetical protein ccbrp13_39250 [Ktedonobacteria bacterium brp13]
MLAISCNPRLRPEAIKEVSEAIQHSRASVEDWLPPIAKAIFPLGEGDEFLITFQVIAIFYEIGNTGTL